MKELVEDDELRCQLSEKGLERARLFNWDRTAERTWAILNMVTQG